MHRTVPLHGQVSNKPKHLPTLTTGSFRTALSRNLNSEAGQAWPEALGGPYQSTLNPIILRAGSTFVWMKISYASFLPSEAPTARCRRL
jgi:hypothetical protein